MKFGKMCVFEAKNLPPSQEIGGYFFCGVAGPMQTGDAGGARLQLTGSAVVAWPVLTGDAVVNQSPKVRHNRSGFYPSSPKGRDAGL